MSRALIVGPRDALARSVDALYELKLLHIVDHPQGEADLEIGKPLPAATEASEVLVKLRSIASILQVQEPKPTLTQSAPEAPADDMKEKILALELNISEEDASKKKIQALLADLNRRVDAITPFAQLPLSLDDYRGYDSLEVFVGKAPREITGLETVAPENESFAVPGFLVVFVVKEHAGRMRDFLAQNGFTSVAVPEGHDPPQEILANLLAERERWEKRLGEIEESLKTLRERYADFLTSARAHLEVEVEKAEAPLRFAVTDHTFIVEGWIPQVAFAKSKADLEKIDGVFVSELETEAESAHAADDGGAKPAPDPPVLLRNPKPIKPFEMLVNMFGAPNYHEIDPTLVFSIAFPIMFGIMVGDAGYGLLWMAYGIWLLRRWKDRPWGFWKNLLVAFIFGGFWATVFGTFVFAEAFGVPFHAPAGALAGTAEFFNWSDSVLHIGIPIYPILEKLHQVPDFIVLSISVAVLHLGTGFIIGFFDEVRHSVKHALGKVGWLLILISLYVIIIVRTARWALVNGSVPWGYAIWNGPLAWFPRGGLEMASVGFTASNPIPMVALYMLGAGLVLALAAEGILNIMELFGLLANMISYARLAGIGVAEEAVIFALNVIVLNALILPGSIVGIIVGIVLMALANLLIFLLSTISGTIQSVRLNYVEFFLKFYKGTGTLFRPFGERAKSEV
jgi:V/A-type H+-transporting ATPase subunit I